MTASRRAPYALVVALACASCATLVVGRDARAADVPAPADAQKERSRAAFKRGVAQLRAEDWAGARASFEQAWTLFPHPSILLNLGIARLKTGDPVLAEQDLVRFLSEDAGASPDELTSAREALGEARARIGTLRVVVSPPTAQLTIDGRAIELVRRSDAEGSLVGEARMASGPHAVSVVAEGYAPGQRDVDVPAKGEAEVRLALVPSGGAADARPGAGGSDARGRTRAILGWSAVGLSGAALLTGGALGLRAMSLADDYADRGSDRFQDPETRSEGVAMRTGADVALGVAVLSGAAAIVLLLTDLGAPAPPPSSAPRNAALLRW